MRISSGRRLRSRRRTRFSESPPPACAVCGSCAGIGGGSRRGCAPRAWSRMLMSSAATCLQCCPPFAYAGHEHCDLMPSGVSSTLTG